MKIDPKSTKLLLSNLTGMLRTLFFSRKDIFNKKKRKSFFKNNSFQTLNRGKMEADCTGASYSKLWNLHQLSCGLKIYRREKERKQVEKKKQRKNKWNKERTNETKNTTKRNKGTEKKIRLNWGRQIWSLCHLSLAPLSYFLVNFLLFPHAPLGWLNSFPSFCFQTKLRPILSRTSKNI